ncbi:hypothetical protein [Sphingobium lignivorans]|uniref:HMA domain-containing protein n=1 Tax=Sphingobium lignivorans TaxID=2735886 RepID=A0ABR6NFD5_9SPHN|nr:hypothetical protein [Sphingobium lignivorans]MBB5985992.1 hypothetical protein [Sphingobium lignivorans]
MTLEEAQKAADIIGTADGGCTTCINRLIKRFEAAFPEFELVRTSEEINEQPEWSDDPDDADFIGYRVIARLRQESPPC